MEKSPARIFVLWHPEFLLGGEIARSIFDWFRTPDGYGLPVYYRSDPGPGRNDGLPEDIPTAHNTVCFVIVLAEVKMVRDRNWRDWLDELATPKNRLNPLIICPVALHQTAYNLPGSIRELNFISPIKRSGRSSEFMVADLSKLLPRMRKSLTEVLSRVLGYEFYTSPWYKVIDRFKRVFSDVSKEPPKIKVFLSHAKKDGAGIASILRDYIYRETQLSAFFDENDIALGYKFALVLERTINRETAAMVAVNSNVYASRPWCRREIQHFTKPRRHISQVWKKPPLLVVQAMQGGIVSSSIPEFGNAPMLRWDSSDIALCIDTLLREAIFRAFHLRHACQMKSTMDKWKSKTNRLFINWPPDAISLHNVILDWEQWKKEEKKRGKSGPVEIVYPGRGLSSIELESLQASFPKITLKSFLEAGQEIQGDRK